MADEGSSSEGAVLLRPPQTVRGMTQLDKDAFKVQTKLPVLFIPNDKMHKTMKVLKEFLMKRPGVSAIDDVALNDPRYKKVKRIIFDPEKCRSVDALPDHVKERFQELKMLPETDFEFIDYEITYDNWKYEEILQAVLPEEEQKVAGFSRIGHILHLNLKEYHEDYKWLIGQVLLEKFSTIRTVVNKVNTIDSTYRNFAMEVLAGEDDMLTTCRENGLQFRMDFSRVFWNPRLGTEHQRITDQLRSGDVVYDVMAGIGPFAVPAAKKQCCVLANDLNPESYKWLLHNMKLNKVNGANEQCFNMDGRQFIREQLKPHLMQQQSDEASQCSAHILMNLPALAVEFLDAFQGLCSEQEAASLRLLPTVHCYSFCSGQWGSEMIEQMRGTAALHLGCPLPADAVIRQVRNVAPGKEMLCVEFKLSRSILCSNADAAPEKKRAKLE
ncbi:hypothetical protein CAPTEDRAFT_218789 [Capitella teleta]|uniref:tRNA (guanine(37)-N1)-methyltransferase n=1 Tax=Capitella teleta TaxID=283909 RepID=R7TC87_CAPTE|nr:hypothetical protein CAPTEDRAFT_218789 [Capitella teleta]|eukprot:ELT91137.1 hypothetical protein CAPTEDRAFT_218789 [Capitella teleta]